MSKHQFISNSMGIIGHRGAAGHAVENSIEAFELAFICDIDAIELDVKYIHEELIVFHDDSVERLTNGSGELADMSVEELQNLRLQNGESIPTLKQVWECVPPSIAINIELKGLNTGKPVAEFVREHSHNYLISSFYVDEISAFKQLAPDIPTALLTRFKSTTTFDVAKELGVDNIHVWDRVAEPDYLLPLIDAGFTTYVFTVNAMDRIKELRALGVKAVFTDVPRELNQKTLAAS